MSREGYYEALWRDEQEAGSVVRAQRDEAVSNAKSLQHQLEEAQIEVRKWRTLALYLADTTAARAGMDLMTKSVSKSRKETGMAICKKALDAIENRIVIAYEHHYAREDAIAIVSDRLRDVPTYHTEKS